MDYIETVPDQTTIINNIINNNLVPSPSSNSSVSPYGPAPHPVNCKTECPYGRGRAFCFPCYAKLMNRQREQQKQDDAKKDEAAHEI